MWHPSCYNQNTEKFIIQLANDRALDKLSNIQGFRQYLIDLSFYKQFFVTAPILSLYN
jgi:hypothetical protein